jgi:type II secretory pathway pseudopilin PulG
MVKLSKMIGVTLLEVMLVLAIAAMIIVLSIRYYQSAQTSQQVNAAMNQVQAIIAAADGIALGTGSYTGVTLATVAGAITPGATTMNSPNGAAITMTTGTATTYTVTMNLGTACEAVKARLVTVPKMAAGTCTGGSITLTYDSTK